MKECQAAFFHLLHRLTMLVLKQLAYFCILSLLTQKVAEKRLAIVVEVHPNLFLMYPQKKKSLIAWSGDLEGHSKVLRRLISLHENYSLRVHNSKAENQSEN